MAYDAEARGIQITNLLGYATLLVRLIPKEKYWRPLQISILPMPTLDSASERETLLFTLGQP
ncbi:MAG: hypothetical protein EOO60_08405 [Hymenobacter sp.]|nr:MAG: hypothetical protein EOO60_08405 [Hymenobacter sp.]